MPLASLELGNMADDEVTESRSSRSTSLRSMSCSSSFRVS